MLKRRVDQHRLNTLAATAGTAPRDPARTIRETRSVAMIDAGDNVSPRAIAAQPLSAR
jgi:hypothetical protein